MQYPLSRLVGVFSQAASKSADGLTSTLAARIQLIHGVATALLASTYTA